MAPRKKAPSRSRKPSPRAKAPSSRSRKRARAAPTPAAQEIEIPQPERRRDPETLRLRAFVPTLTVDDIKRSLRFYSDLLGFIVSEYWTDDGGALRGAMLRAGLCELGLSQDDWKKGRDRKKGEGVRLWCETAQDVDAMAARIKAAGVALTAEPADEEWGSRSFSVDDPDGYHLTLARRVP